MDPRFFNRLEPVEIRRDPAVEPVILLCVVEPALFLCVIEPAVLL